MEDLVVSAHGLHLLSGKQVLVTGHTGFTGSWMLAVLQRLGAEAWGFALPPSAGALFADLGAGAHARSVFGDVRNGDELDATVARVNPDVVIHLAAQALVLEGVRDPRTTFDVNVMGTVNLLDAVRRVRPDVPVVVVTTDKVYAPSFAPHVESDPLGGLDPYSGSKAAAELVVEAMRHTYEGLARVATARAGNVIGGGDRAQDRLLPDCVRAVETAGTLACRFPEAVRPWQHVLDAVRGYLSLAAGLLVSQDAATAWNFGPSSHELLTVGEVIATFYRQWGDGAPSVEFTEAEHAENPRLTLNASRAAERFRWRPLLDTTEAVEWAARWYRAAFDGESPQRLVERDVDRYFELVAREDSLCLSP